MIHSPRLWGELGSHDARTVSVAASSGGAIVATTSAVAEGRLALAAVVLYVLVVTLVTVHYVLWSQSSSYRLADGMKTREAVADAQLIVTE